MLFGKKNVEKDIFEMVNNSYSELEKDIFEVVSGNIHQGNYNHQHYYILWDFIRVLLSKHI